MIQPAISLFMLLLAAAYTPPPTESDIRRFELTIQVKRTDSTRSPQTGASPAVTSESDMTLYGRVRQPPPGNTMTFYADSIRYEGRRPFAFQTFMSADTMYYRAGGGEAGIDHRDAAYDSMLSCLFGGAALVVVRDETGGPDSTRHFNDRCESGEYEQMNAPVTLCAFITPAPGDGDRWRDSRPTPSFSGVGFHPVIDWRYRTVQLSDSETTVTVTADTTIEGLEITMKNGEEVFVVHDRIRIGGTIVGERGAGLPSRAELRVGERLELVRPAASGTMITREGLYSLRFSLP